MLEGIRRLLGSKRARKERVRLTGAAHQSPPARGPAPLAQRYTEEERAAALMCILEDAARERLRLAEVLNESDPFEAHVLKENARCIFGVVSTLSMLLDRCGLRDWLLAPPELVEALGWPPVGSVEVQRPACAKGREDVEKFSAIVHQLEDWARSAFRSAKAQPSSDEFGRRFIEHGAMCYFNSASLLRKALGDAILPASAIPEEARRQFRPRA